MIRGYTDNDYEMVRSWAMSAEQCPPPPFILTRGCFYVYEEVPAVCAFLFIDKDNPLAVISFVYFNPDADNRAKARGLRQVYKALEFIARQEDRCFVITDTAHHSIETVLNKNDYITFLQGASHLMKILPVNDEEEVS